MSPAQKKHLENDLRGVKRLAQRAANTKDPEKKADFLTRASFTLTRRLFRIARGAA